MYAKGLGVPRDDAESVRWYRKAAEQGNTLGQVGLGALYAIGLGVPRDYAEALKWFNLATSRSPPGKVHNRMVLARDFPG